MNACVDVTVFYFWHPCDRREKRCVRNSICKSNNLPRIISRENLCQGDLSGGCHDYGIIISGWHQEESIIRVDCILPSYHQWNQLFPVVILYMIFISNSSLSLIKYFLHGRGPQDCTVLDSLLMR